MRGTAERDRIEELARLLDGDLRAEDASPHVTSLLELSRTVRDEVVLERPDPAFKAALRAELIEAVETAPLPLLARVRDAFWERAARVKRSAKLATASATASMMIGSMGVAAAAQSAVPGDTLYGVKSATESLRFAFASGLEETGRLHLAMAQERLDELTEGLDRMTADQIVASLGRMDASSEAGAEALLAAFAERPSLEILDDLQAFTARQRTVLSRLFGELPMEARPYAEKSLDLLRLIDAHIATAAEQCDCGDVGALIGRLASSTTDGLGDEDATSDADGTLPLPSTRETGLGGSLLDGDGDGSDDVTSDDGALLDDDGGLDLDGGSTTENTLTDTVDSTTDAIDDTTGTVGDTVDDTTDTIDDTASALDETVDGTTEDTTGTVEDTTGTVEDTVDDGGALVDETVEDGGEVIDETIDDGEGLLGLN